MAPAPDYFERWAQATDRKLDILSAKLDDVQDQSIELWQKHHEEVERLRNDVHETHGEHSSKLASHTTELSTWRWALITCVGLVLTAVMTAALAQITAMPLLKPPHASIGR